ncbi:hypothetical protein HHI36_022294 [Cryptolaemus montrouzieri]|uniref:Uncharacterized protein n=1 Tax=Cryptolaemus montrouzieri TaxID=559131 RepID=A0ABD2MZJ3_9CUCU
MSHTSNSSIFATIGRRHIGLKSENSLTSIDFDRGLTIEVFQIVGETPLSELPLEGSARTGAIYFPERQALPPPALHFITLEKFNCVPIYRSHFLYHESFWKRRAGLEPSEVMDSYKIVCSENKNGRENLSKEEKNELKGKYAKLVAEYNILRNADIRE